MSFVSSKGNILCRLIKIELYKIFAIINRAIKGLHCIYILVSWQSYHFFLIHNQLDIWPWKLKVKVMAKVKFHSYIWGLMFNWYVCFVPIKPYSKLNNWPWIDTDLCINVFPNNSIVREQYFIAYFLSLKELYRGCIWVVLLPVNEWIKGIKSSSKSRGHTFK